MNISRLLKKYKYTRSPFIFYDNNMPSMYFTVYENDKWQLYFTDNQKVTKVDIFPFSSINQVTCFKRQDVYCVSFCGEMNGINSLFYAETLDPTKFKITTNLAHNCIAGAVTPNKIMVLNPCNHLLIYQNKEEFNIDNEIPIQNFLFDLKNPTHLSFIDGNDNQILISYRDPQCPTRHGSLYISLNPILDQKQILINDDTPLYDVTIDPLTHQVLYSNRIGIKPYNRKIAKTFLKNITSNIVRILK